ncbi:mandelate racemase/muconate lactonizing enzyme family protein [Teredinibacter sp. KSP-S5-2]|uniref:mandelate racemase/muconate lactonizing enzyme family protein n=1 Tax=Teredinibacter sp. KSP-S5-2 TaxID=3034506 RepID=UPI002935126B|nr:enolase C-terminal domain-like protein [Teredinibacter sp. KSP-S5-2]WNO11154.1 enolase C-terminal domain-like protein [Teredinibacter sp. KSP-S5-2]
MKIVGFRLHETSLPFNIAFNHTTKSRAHVEAVILEIHTDAGVIGYGEVLPRDYVTGETNQSVIEHAVQSVLPALTEAEFADFSEIATWLSVFYQRFPDVLKHEQCVRTLFDLALLDAYGKTIQQPVATLLGGNTGRDIVYSGVITAGNPDIVSKYITAYAKLDLRQFKVKVGGDWGQDLRNIQMLKDACGENIAIRVDANEAWDLATAQVRLAALAELGVTSCEQPMPAEKKHDYPALKKSLDSAMNICIDESLCTIEDAHWFVDNDGADIFNLRVSKNGGILNVISLGLIAEEAGLSCQLGSQVGETSLLTSAGIIVANHLGNCVYHEGAFGTMLLSHDLTCQPLMFGRRGILNTNIIQSQGLGVEVDTALYGKMVEKTYWDDVTISEPA